MFRDGDDHMVLDVRWDMKEVRYSYLEGHVEFYHTIMDNVPDVSLEDYLLFHGR